MLLTLNSEGAQRQVEPYFEAPSLSPGCLGRPAVSLQDLSGNREPDAFSAGVPVPRLRNPIERLEYAFQIPVGHARPAIPNQDLDAGCVARDRDVDGRILGTVAHGVAQHVLDGAAHEIAIAVDGRARGAAQSDRAVLGGA